jgi:hypothetical protein
MDAVMLGMPGVRYLGSSGRDGRTLGWGSSARDPFAGLPAEEKHVGGEKRAPAAWSMLFERFRGVVTLLRVIPPFPAPSRV